MRAEISTEDNEGYEDVLILCEIRPLLYDSLHLDSAAASHPDVLISNLCRFHFICSEISLVALEKSFHADCRMALADRQSAIPQVFVTRNRRSQAESRPNRAAISERKV